MSPNRKNTPNINSFEVRISPNNQKLASSLLLKRMMSTRAVIIPNKTVLGFIVNLNELKLSTQGLNHICALVFDICYRTRTIPKCFIDVVRTHFVLVDQVDKRYIHIKRIAKLCT